MQYLILGGGHFKKKLMEDKFENTWGNLKMEYILDNNLVSSLKFLSVIIICGRVRTCSCFQKVHVKIFRADGHHLCHF